MTQARRDQGASTVELVFWVPFLLIVTASCLQVFSWFWARETAQSAARYGAHHASAYTGADADGSAQALAYLDEVAGDLVQTPAVTVTRTTTTVTVTIRARAHRIPLSVVPSGEFTVQAQGPVERLGVAP
ncbi:pilus assembly protein [Kineosporia sp. J2-2]|uniref:Pilus assembly protein n=1 Tax=Kineosporia corallincola TaxID=2835133 RepID=A0ABS5TTY5_9ACTN|nr:TadE family protein [Kineosporia corallincola]MBT0774271.1 pilus assembly protein [Kineosporia corallincola]